MDYTVETVGTSSSSERSLYDRMHSGVTAEEVPVHPAGTHDPDSDGVGVAVREWGEMACGRVGVNVCGRV